MITNNFIKKFKEECEPLLNKNLSPTNLKDIDEQIKLATQTLSNTVDNNEIEDLQNLLKELEEKKKELQDE